MQTHHKLDYILLNEAFRLILHATSGEVKNEVMDVRMDVIALFPHVMPNDPINRALQACREGDD